MADLNAKAGPFTRKQWLIGGGGGMLAYLGFRWYRNRSGSGAAATSTAPAGGDSIPAGAAGATVTSSGPGTPTTLAGWQQAALAYGDPISTLNAVTNWLAGNCVDQGGYNALAGAIAGLGLPPGFTTLPVLQVCSSGNPQQSSTGSSPAGGSSTGGSGSAGGGVGPGGVNNPQQNQPANNQVASLISGIAAAGQRILSVGQVANATTAVQPTATYTPSPLDLATTAVGGVQRVIVSVPGVNGGSYSLFPTAPVNATAGTATNSPSLGRIIPIAQAIPGEQYQPGPTPGTLQVIN